MTRKIQRVELNKFYDVSIFCPFCGQMVVNYDSSLADDAEMVTPCRHTLFVAHDEGFEYRSGLFNENVGLVGVDDDDIDLPEEGVDGLTDQVSITDSMKFAAYVGPPGGMGSYIGFAPGADD